jgi:hypothetical protein
MRSPLRTLAFLSFLLLVATPNYAQHGFSGGGGGGRGPLVAGGGAVDHSFFRGVGTDSFGSDISGADFSTSLQYDSPRNPCLVYATNDGPFVPSTFMNYQDAVALGRQQLAAMPPDEDGEKVASLGEAARFYRANKLPTFQLKSRVVQDNDGKLQVCNLNGNDCHRP